MADEEKKKKKVNYSSAWAEARKIIWNSRWRLFAGSILMLISRLAGMVLPASTKYIGDEIFTGKNYGLIKWIALAIGISTLVQGVTSFALSQILGVAAQRAITDMRMRVQRHVERLPISYFDSTQSGQIDLADHERRRGDQKSRRHGPRADPRQRRHCRDRDRRAVLSQLAANACDASSCF